MITDVFLISRLIARYLCGELSTEEEQALMEWVHASSDNKDLFHKLCSDGNWKNYIEQASLFNLSKAKQEMNACIQRKKRKIMWQKAYQSAAILLLPILIVSFALYYVSDKKIVAPATTPVAVMPQVQSIMPGGQKACLQLSTGAVIDLEQKDSSGLKEKDGTDILIADNQLKYQEAVYKENVAPLYNKIVVPQGGEYSVKLSDGTVVYINAMSSLKFPVQFSATERVVELDGEAFFDVQRNGTPFIVKTAQTQIEVLGTTFNICAYKGENTCATLVKGSIRISTERQSMLLSPSQQAIVEPNSKNITVNRVDADFYSSWYKGKIYFRDARLGDIMKNLSRWYNIQVSYGDSAASELRFGCYVNRHKEITPFLNHLKNTGKIRILQRGNKISFYSIN